MPTSAQTRNLALGYLVFDQLCFKMALYDVALCHFEFSAH